MCSGVVVVVVVVNERCKGLGCGKSGTYTVEVRTLHSGAGEEEGVSCGVHRDLALCTARCKGSVLDRSAAMIPDEQMEGVTMRYTLTSG